MPDQKRRIFLMRMAKIQEWGCTQMTVYFILLDGLLYLKVAFLFFLFFGSDETILSGFRNLFGTVPRVPFSH
jgi:hypothetical protein